MKTTNLNTQAETPTVSAIITTYKRFEEAKLAVQSAVDQTYSNTEVIVVEDGSNTGLSEWLKDSKLSSVIYHKQPHNRGLAAARNTGTSLASGEYVAFMDDDDIWKPEKLSRQMSLIKSLPSDVLPKVGVIYCGAECHFSDPKIKQSNILPGNDGNLKQAIIQHGAKTVPSAMVIPRFVLDEVGGFDSNLKTGIDHDMWMNLATRGYECRSVPESLVITKHRTGRNTMMTDVSGRTEGIRIYLEKWKPTYREWFGAKRGEEYAKRYYASVIGNMLKGKAEEGDLNSIAVCIRSIVVYSGIKPHSIYSISISVLPSFAKKVLGKTAYEKLRSSFHDVFS